MSKAAILGSGPAGLLAAHACFMHNVEFEIFSLGQKSSLWGAQFLQERVPGVPLLAHEINVQMQGTMAEYRTKVYGPDAPAPSFDTLITGLQVAFDIRSAYDWLWNQYGPGVVPLKLDANWFGAWVDGVFNNGFDYVFSSIPAETLCVNPDHKFEANKVYAIGDGPHFRSPIRVPDESIIYCGNDFAAWYRASNIFGFATVEWPGSGKKPPISGVVPVYKPLSTSCSCHPRVVRIGRFGEWKRGVLATDAFSKVTDHLQRFGVQGVLF